MNIDIIDYTYVMSINWFTDCHVSQYNTVHVVQGWLKSTIYYMSTLLLSQGDETPAHLAAFNDHVEALKPLVAHGASMRVKNKVSVASVVYYTVHITL